MAYQVILGVNFLGLRVRHGDLNYLTRVEKANHLAGLDVAVVPQSL